MMQPGLLCRPAWVSRNLAWKASPFVDILQYTSVMHQPNRKVRTMILDRILIHVLVAFVRCALLVVVPTLGAADAPACYTLSAERYRVGTATNHRFPQVELGSICKPEYGFTASAEDKGDARFVRITDIGPDGRIRKDEPK